MNFFIYTFAFILFAVLQSAIAQVRTFEEKNADYEAMFVDSSNAAVYIGENIYSEKGYFTGTSYLLKIDLDSLQIKSKTFFTSKIVGIHGTAQNNILSVECFSDKRNLNQTYLVDNKNGTIIDSLKQARSTLTDDGNIIYVSKNMISGGLYSSKVETNIHIKKIGYKEIRAIQFNGLTFRMRVFGDTLITLAVPKGGNGLLKAYSMCLNLGGDSIKVIAALGKISLGEETVAEILASDIFLVGNNVYQIKDSKIEKRTVKSEPRSSFSANGLVFLFYKDGYIYLRPVNAFDIVKVEFDEEFDDFAKLANKLACDSHAIQFYQSFYFAKSGYKVIGTIRNGSQKLTISKVQ